MRKYCAFNDLDQLDVAVHGIVVKRNHFSPGLIVSYKGEGRQGNIILYVLHGCLRYVVAGRELMVVEENDIIILPAYSCYDVYNIDKGDGEGFAGIYLRFLLSQDREDEVVPCHAPQLLYRDGSQRLLPVFTSLLDKSLRGSGGRLDIKAELLLCLSSLVAVGHQGVEIALAAINNKLGDNISVAELAAKCRMSESTFRRRFAERTGMAPLDYRNQQRLKKVDELLASGLYSLKGACEIAGFVDTSHYYKTRAVQARKK